MPVPIKYFFKYKQVACGLYSTTPDHCACLIVANGQLSVLRYTEEMVPWHPCLRLVSNCEQKLSSHTARRLITMEKVKEFEVSCLCIFSINSGRVKKPDLSK